MKSSVVAFTLGCCLASVALCPALHAETWEQRKAERFKPVTAEQLAAIGEAAPAKAAADPQQDRKVLIFYRCEGFIHESIPHGNQALIEMGTKSGAFTADLADTYDVFTRENLAQYDAIILNNTTAMVFPEASQHNAFLDFIAAGKGLVGIHAASDNFGRHPQCRAMIGGEFGGHPWNAGGNWAFKLDDPDHVLNQAFEQKGFWHTDEIYQYNPDTYEGDKVLRILVSLDMTKPEVSSLIDDGPREVPVSWLRTAGDGRVFYTNFGHREDTFQNPLVMKHLLDGIQYALGDLAADATPTARITPRQPALAPAK